MKPVYIFAPNRGIIRVTGADSRKFLQGLITNDINLITTTRSIYSALLTPQGKFLFDMFITEHENSFLIDCELDRLPDLIRRLEIYKLRAEVTLADVSAFTD